MTDRKTGHSEHESVSCPTCERNVKWSVESPFRPFCSERCKLIDLGEWVEERREIVHDVFHDSSTS